MAGDLSATVDPEVRCAVPFHRMDPAARRRWEATRPGRDLKIDAACIAPWVALELDPSGWVYACCANQQYPLGRIGRQRLKDLWGGPRARVLRTALADWDLSIGCNSCQWHFEHGRNDPDAAVYDQYPIDDDEPSGPVAMTFALSNRCNLACVMCTPELSSTLRHREGLAPLPTVYDDAFFEDLAPWLPDLRYAKFLGGEPFLIPQHHRVWDLMDSVGGPERMQVTTNGTIWNDRVEMVLDRFSVDVTISIDAVSPARYEAIRVGADRDAVWRNVTRFQERCLAHGTELRLCFCLMASNWEELPHFLLWARELGATVSVNVVSDVGLALHDLPDQVLRDVAVDWATHDADLDLDDHHGEVWRTQREQLMTVLAERAAGVVPVPRQAKRARTDPLVTAPPDSGDLSGERSRLSAWCGGATVAELHLDADGTVSTVVVPHHRLGLVDEVVGRPVHDLIGIVEVADGRPAWTIGLDRQSDRTVWVTALAAEQPVRGDAGSIVRWVHLRRGSTTVLLVAEDRVYDLESPLTDEHSVHPERASTPVRMRGTAPHGGSLTIMMPALNEAGSIERTVLASIEAGTALVAAGTVDRFEVLVVDDGSTDDTRAILDRLSVRHPQLRSVSHPANLGVGAAMRSGFGAATGDLVFYTDSDLPVDLSAITEAIHVMRRDRADVVSAYRRSRTGEGIRRTLYSAIYNQLVHRLLGLRIHDVNFAAKLMSREALERIDLRSNGILIDAELLARVSRAGFRISQFGVDWLPRRAGRSTAARLDRLVELCREAVTIVPDIRRQPPNWRTDP